MKRLLFLSILFLHTNWHVFAQVFVGTGATVYISGDATVGVGGSINNTGTINNLGNISIKGDFINTNTCVSTGKLSLVGLNQQVTHKNGLLSTLIIDNGGTKILTTDITVNRKIDLNNGIVKPAEGIKFLLTKEGVISLGSSRSYVDGMLYREGAQALYYPIGSSGLFAPAELQDISGESPVVGVELVNPANVEMVAGKGCRALLKTRYYKTDIASGTFEKAYVALPFYDADDFISGMKIGVAQADNATGVYQICKGNKDKQSTLANLQIPYVVSEKPVTKKYFTLSSYINADMSLFFLPDALSHNSDFEDDKAVKVYGEVFDPNGFFFSVSNQWGNLVYKTTSLEEMVTTGWRGYNYRTNRKEVTGQYFFVLKATTLDGDKYHKAGSIWIID